MKWTMALAFVLALSVAALAGDGKCWDQGKAKPWEGYNKVVKWESSLSDAQTKARREKKLILYYVLVGDLDKEGCWAAGDVLRTVTFSDEKVGAALSKDFVCAWKNRKDGFHNCDPSAEQGIFQRTADAFPTRNIITLFLTPDLQVVHYFSGYFAPALFLKQVEFARHAREQMFDADFKVQKDAAAKLKTMHEKAAEGLKAEVKKLGTIKLLISRSCSFVRLEEESGGGREKEPTEQEKEESKMAWKALFDEFGLFSYHGQEHKHGPNCRLAINSVLEYLSLVHGDLSGKKGADDGMNDFNTVRKEITEVSRCATGNSWSGLTRENREVKAEPGERKIVEGLPGLSDVEGKYIYGNPFTEE